MGFWGYWEWCGDVCLPERGGAVGLIWGFAGDWHWCSDVWAQQVVAMLEKEIATCGAGGGKWVAGYVYQVTGYGLRLPSYGLRVTFPRLRFTGYRYRQDGLRVTFVLHSVATQVGYCICPGVTFCSKLLHLDVTYCYIIIVFKFKFFLPHKVTFFTFHSPWDTVIALGLAQTCTVASWDLVW